MKNSASTFVALLALVAFSFTSCKKDYNCECKKIHTDSDGDVTTNSDGNYTFKDSQPRAESRCNALEGSGSDLGGTYTRECQIQ